MVIQPSMENSQTMLRKGCRASTHEKSCPQYSYSQGRCVKGRIKYNCELVQQPAHGTKAHMDAVKARAFYLWHQRR